MAKVFRQISEQYEESAREGAMEERFSYPKVAPGVLKAMMGLKEYLRGCEVEESLLHLIKLRAS